MVLVIHCKIFYYRCSIFHVQTPKVHLKLNAFTTIDLEAIVTLRCGSYCNVTVTAVHLDSDVIDVELKGSIDTVGMWQAHVCIV